jgi:hypothetical protein
MLANIYLHEVLDTWFKKQVKPRLKGRASLLRFADDAVVVFSDMGDARLVLTALPKRFQNYGLKLYPRKIRLVCLTRLLTNNNKGNVTGSLQFNYNMQAFCA